MDITHFRLREDSIINFYCKQNESVFTLRGENLDCYNGLEKHEKFLNELQEFENFANARLSCLIQTDRKINLIQKDLTYSVLCYYIGGKWDVVPVTTFEGYVIIVNRKAEHLEKNLVASKLAGYEIKGKAVLLPLEHFRKLK